MKVELSIADDRELRQAIRALIESEVKSIARGEIRSIIHEVFSKKTENMTKDQVVDKVLHDEVAKVVKAVIGSRWNDDVIKGIARSVMNERLEQFFEDRKGNVV